MDKDLHCQENCQVTTAGSTKSNSRQGSPHSINKSTDSEVTSIGKADDRPSAIAASEMFGISTLNGLTSLETSRKIVTIGSMSQCSFTDRQQHSDTESTIALAMQASPLECASNRPEEVVSLQKTILRLLPGMSTDSESECDTENEQEESISTEVVTHNAAVQSSEGDLGISESANFVIGEKKERS